MAMAPSSDSGPRMMDIPELVSALAPYLIPYDMYSCILVNRAWFNSFLPHLWETVRVVDFVYIDQLKSKKRQHYNLKSNPTKNEALRRYGHLIRFLTVGLARSLQQLGPSLTLLRALHFNTMEFGAPRFLQKWTLQGNNSTQQPGATAILCSVFEQNVNTLTTVTMSIVQGDDINALIDALKHLTLLEQLVIYDQTLYLRQEHYLDRLVEACVSTTNLKRLACCQGSGSGDNDEFPALDDRQVTRTQETMRLNGIDKTELPETCTSSRGIQQLRFSAPQGYTAFGRDHIIRTFRGCGSALQRIQFGLFPDTKVEHLLDVVQETCTNLRHLSFRTALGVVQNQDLWIRLLEVCPPLESLAIYNAISAGPLMDYCAIVASTAIHSTNLKQWACAINLRRLTLCIGTHLGHLDSKLVQKDLIRHIFRQAEKLDQLTLVLAPLTTPWWAPTRIPWDKAIVQEEHDAIGYSGSMRCEVGTDNDLVVNFGR
ncbi:hypothetical protein BGW39_001538 [Mortierella sp. 14UC]|nr:hypothetical protein BGW39_001538 [Mortierella sp. 14UC]